MPRYIRSELTSVNQLFGLTDRDAWQLRLCTTSKSFDKVRHAHQQAFQAILDKLQQERPPTLLIIPHWPTAVWWPGMLALQGQLLASSLPQLVLVAMRNRIVAPFTNGAMELCAVV